MAKVEHISYSFEASEGDIIEHMNHLHLTNPLPTSQMESSTYKAKLLNQYSTSYPTRQTQAVIDKMDNHGLEPTPRGGRTSSPFPRRKLTRSFIPPAKPSTSTSTSSKLKSLLTSSPFHLPSTHRPRRPPGQRQGAKELGKYHRESRMPLWLEDYLLREKHMHQPGVIPILSELLDQNDETSHATLCDERVPHVSRLKREGGFCGYRNVQMMVGYMMGAGYEGWEKVGGELPDVFEIQEWIETAWDMGINERGRRETGGVRGTRKFIGTAEAFAALRGLGFCVEVKNFKDPDPKRSRTILFREVERYFASGVTDPTKKVRHTKLPPIYFQHKGHSMTIIGFERKKDGSTDLLVFDPGFKDSKIVLKLLKRGGTRGRPVLQLKIRAALRRYRKGRRYVAKYDQFEILKLQPPDDAIQAVS